MAPQPPAVRHSPALAARTARRYTASRLLLDQLVQPADGVGKQFTTFDRDAEAGIADTGLVSRQATRLCRRSRKPVEKLPVRRLNLAHEHPLGLGKPQAQVATSPPDLPVSENVGDVAQVCATRRRRSLRGSRRRTTPAIAVAASARFVWT